MITPRLTKYRSIFADWRAARLALCVVLLLCAALTAPAYAGSPAPPSLTPPVYVDPDPLPQPSPPPTTLPPIDPIVACGDCLCFLAAENTVFTQIPIWAAITRNSLYPIFWSYQNWIVRDFFYDPDGTSFSPGSSGHNGNILGAMMDMAQQLSTVGMEQVAVYGALLDAKDQLETQAIFESLTADAHKRYQPDTDMCTIGTASEGIAAAYRNAETKAVMMAKRSIDRQMDSSDTESANGDANDRAGRLQQVVSFYCDPSDLGGSYSVICPTPAPAASIGKDVDYTHTVDLARTINIDPAGGGTLTADERDLMALDANLFAHDIPSNLNENLLITGGGPSTLLAMRSVIAKRSVAENSFFAISSMKVDGSPDAVTAQPYLKVVLEGLGIGQQDAGLMLGDRPSYYALMDVMASKIYQNPVFFSNLYTTPANIARKDTAMQAIGLMVDRDQYKSELRSEADMAVLLELELSKLQDKVQGRANWLTENGRKD